MTLTKYLTTGILFFVSVVLPTTGETAGGSTATGTSRAFNPAISVNGLFLGFYGSESMQRRFAFAGAHVHDEHGDEEEHEEEGEDGHTHADGDTHSHGLPEQTGLHVQEVEVYLSAFVDPYLKGDVTLAVPGTSGLELEEGILTTVGLPSVTLKAGKFYADFGKHNLLHTHAFPFVDPPVVSERVLGGEGLNEMGLGLSALLPTEWYSEATFQVLNGDNELFASPDGEDLAYVGRWKNLWDLDESTTLELGGSFAAGRNAHGRWTRLFGGDLTIKWRPARRERYRGLTIQSEYVGARMDDGEDVESVGGLYALVQAQVDRRWWLQARYDVFGLPRLEPHREHRLSGLLAYTPSEFSSIRLQYSLYREGAERVHQLVLQLNFTMGSHPAHSY